MEHLITSLDEIAHHRNGISGESFYAVRFRSGRDRMLAILFDGPGRVAVLNLTVAQETVAFGANSWHGDRFEAELRPLVWRWETTRGEMLDRGADYPTATKAALFAAKQLARRRPAPWRG